MSNLTSADLEESLAKAFGRKPHLERYGSTMGLPILDSKTGNRPIENATRQLSMENATEAARELVTVAQSRNGMTREAAERMVNDLCTSAYEQAARNSSYESDRFSAVNKIIEAKTADYKHKTPLVTESQSVEIRMAGQRWKPEQVKVSEHRRDTGEGRTPAADKEILNALKGR